MTPRWRYHQALRCQLLYDAELSKTFFFFLNLSSSHSGNRVPSSFEWQIMLRWWMRSKWCETAKEEEGDIEKDKDWVVAGVDSMKPVSVAVYPRSAYNNHKRGKFSEDPSPSVTSTEPSWINKFQTEVDRQRPPHSFEISCTYILSLCVFHK